jgi:hypothetical protein
LQCELDPGKLKAHYSSYLAVGLISVYNPVSIISEIDDFWVNTSLLADKALQQIIDKNYRNREGLSSILILREYGIASYHLMSFAKGRYLKLNGQGKWVEKDDPAKAPARF